MVYTKTGSQPATSAANAALAPYARVKLHLKDGLASGRWPAGALMPSEAALVAQIGLSRMSVNRALRELQSEGLINRTQGRGTFAAPLNRVSSRLTIRDLHEELESGGYRHHAVVHLAQAEPVPPALAERLALTPGQTVFHTLIVHHRDGLPLQCEDRYVNPACAPDYLSVDFTQTTPTAYLLQVAPLWEAQYSIEAGLASALEAQLLGIEPDAPCLVVVRRTVSGRRPAGRTTRPAASGRGGTPITLARLVHPGNRYTLEGQFQP
jgi:GntR family histidine utilization transcriptional repressor